jgi:formamidopyrimidine-DNA glycosylase
MPELPEVEHAARCLRSWLAGRTIVRAEVEQSRVIGPSAPRTVAKALTGRHLVKLERRGKYLLFTFDKGQGALAHLGMTGKWLRRTPDDPPSHSRLRLFLDDGAVLHYRDPRMFGLFYLEPAEGLHRLRPVAQLGPEALDPKLDLAEVLRGSKQPVKVALMDQSRLAGLGNIYAAEVLYQVRIDPRRKAGELRPAEYKALERAIRQVLKRALKLQDVPEEITYVEEGGDNPFQVYGRPKERCRRCGGKIASFTQAGRTTWWCPGCQR